MLEKEPLVVPGVGTRCQPEVLGTQTDMRAINAPENLRNVNGKTNERPSDQQADGFCDCWACHCCRRAR